MRPPDQIVGGCIENGMGDEWRPEERTFILLSTDKIGRRPNLKIR